MRSLVLALLVTFAGHASESLPPVSDVPDPYGLGPRLALIDYLREQVGVEPETGDLDTLVAQYQRIRAQRAPKDRSTAQRRAALTRRLWVDHGIAAPDDASLDGLVDLLAAADAEVERELARQREQAAVAAAADGDRAEEQELPSDTQAVADSSAVAPVASDEPPRLQVRAAKGIPRSTFEALDAPSGEVPLPPEEIAARYASAVTVVLTDDTVGTGFFLGSNGLMLTCAHVLPEDGGNLGVKHHSIVDGRRKHLLSPTSLLAIDRNADLALLQVQTAATTTSVRLSSRRPVRMGQEVAIIGNPGANGTVLERTMTQGIVSNPQRLLKGVPHIQTNAPINPGNSGGPMFDAYGDVCGLVVSKANAIDGVGFAVTRLALVGFLEQASH